MSEDTPLKGSPTKVDPEAPVGMESSTTEDTPYLADPSSGTVLYKTQEEALKGIHEKDATIAKMGERLKSLEQTVQSTNRDEQIAETLKTIAEAKSGRDEAALSLDDIMAKIDENPGQGVLI